jgi:molecular chaperone GrpE
MYEVQNADVPEGTVVDVMQAGYTIGDRCLRPALVAVAKGGNKPGPQKQGDGNGTGTFEAANDDFPGGLPPGD